MNKLDFDAAVDAAVRFPGKVLKNLEGKLKEAGVAVEDGLDEFLPSEKTVIGALAAGTLIAAVTACGSDAEGSELFGPGSGSGGVTAGTAGTAGSGGGMGGKAGTSGKGGTGGVAGSGGKGGKGGIGGQGGLGGTSVVGGNGGTVSGAAGQTGGAGTGGVNALGGSAGTGAAGNETGGSAGTGGSGALGGSAGTGGSGGMPVSFSLDFSPMNSVPCYRIVQKRGAAFVYETPDATVCEASSKVINVQDGDKVLTWFRDEQNQNVFKVLSSLNMMADDLGAKCSAFSQLGNANLEPDVDGPGFTTVPDENANLQGITVTFECPIATVTRFTVHKQ